MSDNNMNIKIEGKYDGYPDKSIVVAAIASKSDTFKYAAGYNAVEKCASIMASEAMYCAGNERPLKGFQK